MKKFSNIDRRSFIKLSAGVALAAGASSLLSSNRVWAQSVGANDAIRVGVIGLGRKAPQLVKLAQGVPGVRITALCDVDPIALAKQAKELKLDGSGVFKTTDARKLLERSDVDAVIIATTNHWHALLTVWACQAGKDVYVEKPVSHTIWEGRKMIEAAAKYNRIVQTGTQLRSDVGIAEAVRSVKAGEIGNIKHIHGLCYTKRDDIGRKLPWYPDWLDYDVWCGPVPVDPLERNELHYDWHWKWDTGNGDMANIGAHVIDIARRFVGDSVAPRKILSAGGRYGPDDAAETPNTQISVFDYPNVPVVFESRGLTTKPDVDNMDQFKGIRTGVVVQCEGGYYAGYIGGGLYDNNGKLIRRIRGDGGAAHFPNFFEAVRSRKSEGLAASLDVGCASTSTCHFANISYRTGEIGTVNDIRKSLDAFPVAQETLERMEKHLAVHNVDLNKNPLTLGGWIAPDLERGEIASMAGVDDAAQKRARFLLKGAQRPPYIISEKV